MTTGLGSNFQDLGDGRHWIDGVEVDGAEFARRRDAAMALSDVRHAAFEAERQDEAEESNRVTDWLRAEQEWAAENPDPDAPTMVRPSELRAMIAAEVAAALAVAGTPAAHNGDVTNDGDAS